MIKNKINETIPMLDALKQIFPKSSNNTLREMLKNKRVLVDNCVISKPNHLLQSGQTIVISDKTKTSSTQSLQGNLKILYEDEYLIVINKPEIMLSVPTDKGNEPNILNILREHYNNKEIFAVHRIDKETSGVMIFAKGNASRQKIDEMFKNHLFTRKYLAIVKGNVKEDLGSWKNRLIELDNLQVVPTRNDNEGKIAVTHFRVLKRLKKYTYLELSLETGRKHQIRVQAKAFGHPIVGDKRYGSKAEDPISRICLHAYILEFIHPFSEKQMSFKAPIPYRFSRIIDEE